MKQINLALSIGLMLGCFILADQRLIQVYGVMPNVALACGIAVFRVLHDKAMTKGVFFAVFAGYAALLIMFYSDYLLQALIIMITIVLVVLLLNAVTSQKFIDFIISLVAATIMTDLTMFFLGLTTWQFRDLLLEILLNGVLCGLIYFCFVGSGSSAYQPSGNRPVL